ncbi:HAD family phosphatase [Streptomyces sp. ID01-12c]|uniref:HAD family phosphatase n=1 Tax=Streptomyces caniscabiei TaxID=2746961 RepID=UPI00177FB54D|nr:HAD family phosphatase [Streptomyces caniscabiei]MBD9704644.1 HAD family phosphatase [Streptomyces caniscabiei]MDX3733767.1 HAD family phosphatase [Streptomyces caniscabiei]
MSQAPLRTLRLAAVDIDGVLLDDTFSPVIHRLAVRWGLDYTPELEHAVFSRSRLTAAQAFVEAAGAPVLPHKMIDAYFAERERYLRTHPVRVADGALALLRRLRDAGLQIVCYGGLDKSHFDRHLGAWASYFAGPRYVCTDGFRPGIAEITRDVWGLGFDQVLFIDDVASVAEEAKELGVAFVGHPSSFAHGFQRQLMRAAGVRHMVDSLSDIDEDLLLTLDRDAAEGTVWPRREAQAALLTRGVRP